MIGLHHKRRRAAVQLGCVLLVAALLNGCSGAGSADTPKAGKKGKGEGAAPVLVAKVIRKDVPVQIEVIGNVEAYSTITVKALVGGELQKVNFHEGDYVKKGDLLFTIDRRPLEAALGQVEATLARDEAVLNQYEANLARDAAQQKYQQAEAARYVRLFQEGIISKEQSDLQVTNADTLQQSLAADKAAIASAKADINAAKATADNARVQLGYTEIRSPIDGRTGNLAVKQGNIVTANTSELMTINEVQPIYVTFTVPEARLGEVKRYMAEGKLPVTAEVQDGGGPPEMGFLTFVDNAVDPTTGTIKLKGTFPNPDRRLWPGQFVRVSLRLTTVSGALILSNQAVQTGQEGPYVYVVKPDRTVELRNVTTAGRVDQDMVIDKGLEEGETVVTEGQLRLAPGMRVSVRDGREGQGAPGGKKRRPPT